jgi:predicted MFS family arabinose efflux permease
MCSTLYGTQTVLLLIVARGLGLGAQGYGYLFAAIGVGGLLGTVLAGRASRVSRPRLVLAAALLAAGLPTMLLAVTHWPAALTGLTGTGALLVEIMTDTGLQRMLDEDVFGRAYGLAIPASLGGIVVGSLIAPVLATALGGSGALVAVGGGVLAYAALVLRDPAASHGRVSPPVVAGAAASR